MKVFLLLPLIVFTLPTQAADDKLPPLYSLAVKEGHESFKCTGKVNFAAELSRGKRRHASGDLDASVECKRITSKPGRECHFLIEEKLEAPLQQLMANSFEMAMQVFSNFYLSKERAGSFPKARKVGAGWEVPTPRNGTLFVNNEMTEMKADRPDKVRYGLARFNDYLTISSINLLSPKQNIRFDYVYQEQDSRVYPKEINSFVKSSHAEDDVEKFNIELKSSIKIDKCVSS